MSLSIPAAFEPLLLPARYKACVGGRGSAKSHSIATALVLRGVQRPLRWLCAREIQRSLAASVHQLMCDKIREAGLSGAYHVTRDGIRGPNGTHFLFAGLRNNPDSVKSMEGLDGAWVEEASRCSQKSLDLLTPTIRKEGSEIWCSWNRENATDPVDNLFLGGEPPPGSAIMRVSWRDNPFFPAALREEMEWTKRRDVDKWRHIWEGELLVRTGARVFPSWTEDDLDDDVPASAVPRLGADWGYSVDPTVLVKCYRFGRTLYVAREAYRVGCEIDEIPSLFAGSDVRDPPRWRNPRGHRGIEGALSSTIVADSSRPDTISYMRRAGFSIRGAVKGARSIEEGVEFIRSHDIVVHPSCKHVLDELRTYSYEVDPITDEVLPRLADRDNHLIDALRYALESERRTARSRAATGGARTVSLRG